MHSIAIDRSYTCSLAGMLISSLTEATTGTSAAVGTRGGQQLGSHIPGTTAEPSRQEVRVRDEQVKSEVISTQDVVIGPLKGGCVC
jgi:hypothetical protein